MYVPIFSDGPRDLSHSCGNRDPEVIWRLLWYLIDANSLRDCSFCFLATDPLPSMPFAIGSANHWGGTTSESLTYGGIALITSDVQAMEHTLASGEVRAHMLCQTGDVAEDIILEF